ncbi:transposable element Tcb1 transposase [Trichonephila clavipes]|uniref:Transposable element Tcb1 transposase n=1 Tax=Trichonephila clavipes TaxID=2585209 RepID=A0A8X6V0E9_TRICX|nr:transposable element Tcb1 transposase [Trichonephila clavipes]
MSRRKQRSAIVQVSEFDRGRKMAYRDCRLSFRKIGSRVGRNQTTVMRICDRWMQEESGRTIRRRLQQSGLSARRPLLGLPLTQNHRRLRHQWCDERRMWVAEWNEVVFTDESRICLQYHDSRIRIELLPWPARSPDISPIENMWSLVAEQLTQITPPAATPDQLWQRVEAA